MAVCGVGLSKSDTARLNTCERSRGDGQHSIGQIVHQEDQNPECHVQQKEGELHANSKM